MFANQLCRVIAYLFGVLENEIYGYLHPFIVIFLSIVIAYTIYKVKLHGLRPKIKEKDCRG